MGDRKFPDISFIREHKAVVAAAVAGVAAVAVAAALLVPRVFGTSASSSLSAAPGYVPATNTLLEGPTINEYITKICVPNAGDPNLPKPTLSSTVSPDGADQIPLDMRENVQHLVFVFGVASSDLPTSRRNTSPQANTVAGNYTNETMPNVIKITTERAADTPYSAWLAWDPDTYTLYFVTGTDDSGTANVDESKLVFNPNSDSLFAGLRNIVDVKMYTGGSFSATASPSVAGITYTPGTAVTVTNYDLIKPFEYDKNGNPLAGQGLIGPSLNYNSASPSTPPLSFTTGSSSPVAGLAYPEDPVNNTVKDTPSGWEFTYGISYWNLSYQTVPTVRDPPRPKGLTAVQWVIDADYFDLTHAIYLGSLFEEWESVRSLEIRNWDTSAIGTSRTTTETIDMHSMFKDMKSLEALILPEKFVDKNVARIDHMFQDDTMLSLVIGTSGNSTDIWKKATTLNSMTWGTPPQYGEAEGVIPGWDQPDLTTWGFGGKWYLEDWDVSGISDMSFLFTSCWSLQRLDLRAWELKVAYLPTATTILLDAVPTTTTSPTLSSATGLNTANPVNPTVPASATAVNIYAMFDGAGLEEMLLPNYPALGYTPIPPRVAPLSVSQLDQPITGIGASCELYDADGNYVIVL